jgi:predicted nucleotidyltransferase
MERTEVINKLKQRESDLKRAGVQHLYLFGSIARGEGQPDSDVDLFFDYEKGKIGLFDLMNLSELTADILGCETDIMTRNSLHPMLRHDIETTAIRVF